MLYAAAKRRRRYIKNGLIPKIHMNFGITILKVIVNFGIRLRDGLLTYTVASHVASAENAAQQHGRQSFATDSLHINIAGVGGDIRYFSYLCRR